MSIWRAIAGQSRNARSCITSPATAGSPIPAALLRVTIEMSTASAVKPKTGGSTDTHASATRAVACPGGSRTPDRLIRGCRPTTRAPAATLLVARIATAAAEKPSAVSTFPANISPRLRDRVSTVVHVP